MSGIKDFNYLPQTTRKLATDERTFNSALRRFYITISFIL
jgi:hypothetical protein